jgi:hypothetical protein
LPEAQRLHDLYGESGLVVLTVVHQYGADQVKPFLDDPPPLGAGQRKPGPYTFRVASDPTGSLAQAYQVNHRPTDYVIGVDGRVLISNGWDLEKIRSELAKFRKNELGSVPAGLPGVSEAVASGELGNYGEALRLAQAAAARPDASAEVKAFAARLEPLARRKLEEALAVARVHQKSENAGAAREAYEGLAKAYADTPLAERAKGARDAFVAATSKGS